MPQITEFKTIPSSGGGDRAPVETTDSDVELDVRNPGFFVDLNEKVSYAQARHHDLLHFRETWGSAIDDDRTASSRAGSENAPRGVEPINRAAHYPKSHILHFSVLAGIVLVEGLANAYFFSKGSDLGLLGGWLQAITVSFTNVIAAFFIIGFIGLRHLSNPHRPLNRVLAGIGITVTAMALIALNLTAAHYRDLLEFNADALAMVSAGQAAPLMLPVQDMLTNGFNIQTLEALLLLILGTTFAAIAAFKGRTFDDAIPGYGAVTRKAELAAADLKRSMEAGWKKTGSMGEDELRALKNAMDLHAELCRDLAGPTRSDR